MNPISWCPTQPFLPPQGHTHPCSHPCLILAIPPNASRPLGLQLLRTALAAAEQELNNTTVAEFSLPKVPPPLYPMLPLSCLPHATSKYTQGPNPDPKPNPEPEYNSRLVTRSPLTCRIIQPLLSLKRSALMSC